MAPGGAPAAARTQEPAAFSCPSAPATPGAGLLGILGPDGQIHNLRTALTVDESFLATARNAGPVEARMRFSGTCQTTGCAQWTGARCGVIDRVMAQIGPLPPKAALQPCTIRQTCRWFDQTGPSACTGCALVVTDTRAATRAAAE